MTIPRVALIGVTGFGAVHFEHLTRRHEAGRLQLVAATVVNPSEAAAACARMEQLGVRRFADYREMLAAARGTVDLCCIPTGISWHSPMTCDALAAGCNVLVEKPLAGTTADADRMIAAAQETGRFVAVGFHDLWHPVTLELKRQLLAGAVGEIRRIAVLGLWARPLRYYRRNAWAGRLRDDRGWVYDSPANNAMAHHLNLALFLGGRTFETPLTPVSVAAVLWRANPIESFDTISANWTTEEGVTVSFHGTHATATHRNIELRIEGTKGIVQWESETRCRLQPATGPAMDLGRPCSDRSRELMFDAVVARVTDPGQWIYTPEMARSHTAAIELLHVTTPIHPAPAARVQRQITAAGEEIIVIADIDRELTAAFESGVLLGTIH